MFPHAIGWTSAKIKRLTKKINCPHYYNNEFLNYCNNRAPRLFSSDWNQFLLLWVLVCLEVPLPKCTKNHMWRQSLPSFACKCTWFVAFILKAIKWKAILLWTLLYFQYEMVVVHMKGSPLAPLLTTYRWCFSKKKGDGMTLI